ncbi:WXG100 family type VII secretion target (plasmid) [Mycolicibacterium psychrotolerans]|uniref:WXG100 family type VII secretion target n=1 Tax=Mycolicibacterium psychrotolerans TaxID=216929 RepID=UPI003D676EE1
MSDSLKVTPEDLTRSGQAVAWHCDDVAERHASADALIEGATPGWTGASAAALAARMTQWQATTAALVEQLGTHASNFTGARVVYDTTEEHGAQELSQVNLGAEG